MQKIVYADGIRMNKRTWEGESKRGRGGRREIKREGGGRERERETERWSGRKRLKEKKERRKQSSAPLSFAIMHGTSRRAVHLQRGCKTFRYRDIFFFFFFCLPYFILPRLCVVNIYISLIDQTFPRGQGGGGATRSHNAIKPYRYTVFFYIIERHN